MISSTAEPHWGATDLLTVIDEWVRRSPELEVLGFIGEGAAKPSFLTYASLRARAAALAERLLSVATPGDRAIILHEPGLGYVVAFVGCMMAGIVAVPAYPPRGRRGLDRLRRLVNDASCTMALTSADIGSQLLRGNELGADLRLVIVDSGDPRAEPSFKPVAPRPGDVAYLQYTSGSTLTPRGVMVTHANLSRNIAAIADAFSLDRRSRGAIWLPPYHDMGLIGGILTPLYQGFPCLLMTPAIAIRQPVDWLRWIGWFGATVSGGPDFAYRHALRSVTAEQKQDLDLSSWQVAFCGAETIKASTVDGFAEAFAPCGFRRAAFLPCYGLAEATLIVSGSGSAKRRGPETFAVDAESLAGGTVVARVDGKRIVNCGPVVLDTKVVIADDLGHRLPEETIGEILVAGPGVSPGYAGAEQATAATFDVVVAGDHGTDRYMRTGDLGFLRDGELFVTGRIKELIVVRGRKFHPHDIEEWAEQAFGTARPSGIAAFAAEIDGTTTGGLAVELDRTLLKSAPEDLARLATRVREEVGGRLDVAVGPIAFLRPGGLPRTSSGKLQRSKCGEMFAAGTLDPVHVDRGSREATPPPAGAVPAALPRGFPLAEGRGACIAAVESLLAEIGVEATSGVLTLDSLKIVQFSALVERDFGLHVAAADLFAAETVDDLTTLLGSAPACRRQPAPGSSLSQQRCRVAPLSAGQRGLWFIDSLTGASAAYNTSFAASIAGVPDLDAMRTSVQRLGRRHAALRVRFADEDTGPVQIDADTPSVEWRTIDAWGWSDGRLDAALTKAAATPFDLRSDPSVRCHVFRRAADDHVILIVTHHIRVDFWSFQLIVEDLLHSPSGDQGKEARKPGHYFDFVHWQDEYLASERAATDLAYWRDVLSDVPTLELPLDRTPDADDSAAGAAYALAIDPALAARLTEFCRERGYTTGMMVLAAYALLLQSLSGQDDVVVGVPFSGRTRADFFETVGYFVNPLPQRIRARDDDTVTSFLDRVRDTMLAALDHQDFPSSLMAREMQGARSRDGNTLFQTMMVLNQPHLPVDRGTVTGSPGRLEGISDDGLSWRERPLPQQFTKFDLVLAGLETASALELTFQYRRAVLDRDTVVGFGAALERILGQLVGPGDVQLASVDALTNAERSRIEGFEAGPTRAWALDRPIHRRIEQQVQETPDAVACIHDGRRLSYRQLNERANSLAARLGRLGVGPGRFVGVLVDRYLELPVAWLGVMKSGAAFVPLDPEWPLDRLRRVATQCDMPCLVTTPDLAVAAGDVGMRTLTIMEWPDEGHPDPDVKVGPEDPVYAFSTSGSTGVPKCAAVPHRGIANRFAWMDEFFGPAAAKRVLQTTRPVYDSAVWQLLWPLVNGGATVIPPAGRPLVAETVLGLVESESITMTDFVPSVFNLIVGQIGDDACTRRALGSLTTVILGGEEITPESTRNFMGRFPSIRVVNLYGPTEASIGCIACEVDRDGSGRIPIGRPIANVRVRIVDRSGRPVPAGAVGEIVIGGPAVGLGYVGDEESTARVFIRDKATGGTSYRTGDLARWMPDGSIDFRGRRDHQVKIRGHRIELGEVESVLRLHPDVAAAVATVHRAPSGGRQLVAYVVGTTNNPDTVGVLDWVRAKLPGWMVPVCVEVLDELPLSPSGKVDRTRLPAPRPRTTRPPESETERRVAALWCRVLGVENTGLDDDFFASGGDSLLATRLMAMAQREFAVTLPLRELFERPTLAHLAALVDAVGGTDAPAIGRASEIDERNAGDLLANLKSLTDEEMVELAARLETEELARDDR